MFAGLHWVGISSVFSLAHFSLHLQWTTTIQNKKNGTHYKWCLTTSLEESGQISLGCFSNPLPSHQVGLSRRTGFTVFIFSLKQGPLNNRLHPDLASFIAHFSGPPTSFFSASGSGWIKGPNHFSISVYLDGEACLVWQWNASYTPWKINYITTIYTISFSYSYNRITSRPLCLDILNEGWDGSCKIQDLKRALAFNTTASWGKVFAAAVDDVAE